MKMNVKMLPTALGLIGLVAGGAAYAADALPVPGGAADVFLISGSTALDNQVKAGLLLSVANGSPCVAGTTAVYTDAPILAPVASNIKKAHQTVVTCNLSAAIGTIAAGTQVAFTKESNGGSNEGTAVIANGTTLAFLDATQAPVGCGPAIAVAAGAVYRDQVAYTEFDGCTGPLVNQTPQIGLADEDPALFNLGPQAVTAATITKLTTTPLFQNQFAIAVSLELYRALQRAQGLALTDTLATMPTLSRTQINGILNGSNTTWDIAVAGPTGLPITNAAYNTTGAPTSMWICRRGQSSGTEVSADVYFLHNRCISGNAAMAPVSTTAANCGGLPAGQTAENFGCKWAAVNLADPVFAGAGGGDVDSCLHAHDVANQFAIGFLGATQTFDDPNGLGGAPAVGSHQWRYVALNGFKPTVEGMANGTYDYVFDNVLNVNKSLAGNPLAAATKLTTLFQSPVALEDIIVVQTTAADANYAVGGLQDALIGTQNTLPSTLAQLEGTGGQPTSAFTFDLSGSANNCSAPTPVGRTLTKEQF